jgi:Zn-dependent protease
MAIYIAKNGQRLGPYSVAETQNLLRSGTVAATDLAWQEGLTNWIPLNQIPGFTFVRPAAPVAPVATTTPEQLHRSPAQNKSLLQKIGAGIAAIGYAALKFKFLLFGALKTSLSMLFTIWVYSMLFGWRFAAGLVVLIFVHEMGHVIAAKWLGIPVSAPLFVPFLGAAIIMKQNPRDAWTEALMAYGGPLAGCIGSWICWAIALHMQENWVMAVASVSFFINIFNMIPVPPLDGGRICSAVSPWFWIIGLVLLGVSVLYFHSLNSIFIIILVLIVAFPRIKQTLFGQTTPELQAYYNTHISNRLIMALLYLGLIAVLMYGYWDSNNRLSGLADNS